MLVVAESFDTGSAEAGLLMFSDGTVPSNGWFELSVLSLSSVTKFSRRVILWRAFCVLL